MVGNGNVGNRPELPGYKEPEKQESFKKGLKTFGWGVLKLIASGLALGALGYILATHGPR